METNGIEVIIRSHECVMDGIEKFADTNLYTVFSCTDYGGKYKNMGAILVCHKNWTQIDAKVIKYQPGSTYWLFAQDYDPENAYILASGTKNKTNDRKIYSSGGLGKNRPLTPIRPKRRK